MSESWEGYNDENTEETDLFGNESDDEENQPQAGLSGSDVDPNLTSSTLQAPTNQIPGAQNVFTTQIVLVPAPHQQWQNSQSALASRNPGPPPDQLAMDAVMTDNFNSKFTEYPNHSSSATGQGSDSQYEYAPSLLTEYNPSHVPMGYGTNMQDPPFPPISNQPGLPYGANPFPSPGPRPTVDERGNVVGAPAIVGPSAGHSLQSSTGSVPERAPTQHRYGLPGLDYLPNGYSWSDNRCNNCNSEGKICSLFPKSGPGVQKDLTKTLFKFPCDRCASDSVKTATCTWSIMKGIIGKEGKLYWNGAQAISDPTLRTGPENKYDRYKYYKVIDRLERPPWPQHTGPSNQPGVYQTRKEREAFQKDGTAVKPVPPTASPKDQSGKVGKLAPRVATKRRGPYNSRTKKTCNACREIGMRVAKECDIATKQPCSRCEYHPDVDEEKCHVPNEEEDSDSELSVLSDSLFLEEPKWTRGIRRSGRVRSSLAR